MQTPDTTDAPLVPHITEPAPEPAPEPIATDGGRRPPERPLDRPPRTDHATGYTRDAEEIEPFVADLR